MLESHYFVCGGWVLIHTGRHLFCVCGGWLRVVCPHCPVPDIQAQRWPVGNRGSKPWVAYISPIVSLAWYQLQLTTVRSLLDRSFDGGDRRSHRVRDRRRR